MQRLIDRQVVKKRGVVKIAFIGIKDMVAGDKAQIPLFSQAAVVKPEKLRVK